MVINRLLLAPLPPLPLLRPSVCSLLSPSYLRSVPSITSLAEACSRVGWEPDRVETNETVQTQWWGPRAHRGLCAETRADSERSSRRAHPLLQQQVCRLSCLNSCNLHRSISTFCSTGNIPGLSGGSCLDVEIYVLGVGWGFLPYSFLLCAA